MNAFGGPKNYGTYADFEREELRPMGKIGFSLEDLESEATFTAARDDFAATEVKELDFD